MNSNGIDPTHARFKLTPESTIEVSQFPDGYWRFVVKDHFVADSIEVAVAPKDMENFAQWILKHVSNQIESD